MVVVTCLVALTAHAQGRRDLFIPVSRTDSVDASLFLPSVTPPQRGFPAILFVHGFGLSKDWDTTNARSYAQRGYVTLCYSVRGHGRSSGGSTIMATQEHRDLKAVVRWLRRLPGVDSTSIGVTGGSQGGLHALWATSGIPGVRAVSADVITPHWASGMFVNGSVRRTLIPLLTASTVRYTPGRDSLLDDLRHDRYDLLRRRFAAGRDITIGKDARVPLALFLKWQDQYFIPNEGMDAYARYRGSRRLYLGTVGHFSDWNANENVYQNALVTQWFARMLKGDEVAQPEPQVVVASSSLPAVQGGGFTWTHRAGMPVSAGRIRLYLGSEGTLSAKRQEAQDSTVVMNDYRRDWYTFDTARVEGFRGPRFDLALTRRIALFTSEPLREDLFWFGAPTMHFWIRSASAIFPLHVQIWEVDSLGGAHFVNRIPFTARGWRARGVKRVTVEGIAHAHRFSRGSRIRAVLTNIDVAPRPGLEGYPFTLPVLAGASATVLLGGSHPSSIDLPVAMLQDSASSRPPPVRSIIRR
jgi:predicted acyl esterase